MVNQILTDNLIFFLCIICILKLSNNPYHAYKPCRHRSNTYSRLFSLWIFAKKLKITHIIKDVKLLLVSTLSKKILAKSGTSPNHLFKLNSAIYLFCKYKIRNLRDIHTGLQHIHRHRNKRIFIRLFEILQIFLCIWLITNN